MNTYKIHATKANGTPFSDKFADRNEAAARKSFKEFYSREHFTINRVEVAETYNAESSPVAACVDYDEYLSDLANFSMQYVPRIRQALIANASRIAKDPTIVRLLHEYADRRDRERARYELAFRKAVEYGYGSVPSNTNTAHANSYRDVLEDLLRPMWEEVR